MTSYIMLLIWISIFAIVALHSASTSTDKELLSAYSPASSESAPLYSACPTLYLCTHSSVEPHHSPDRSFLLEYTSLLSIALSAPESQKPSLAVVIIALCVCHLMILLFAS